MAAAGALLLLCACDPWDCAFESHGACIEFTAPPADLAGTRARVDALLARELAFWEVANLEGWRVQFRDTAYYPCYLADRNDGCTDYLQRTLSVRLTPDMEGCFEAAELLHEIGHYVLGDPMHSNDRWRDVDGAFAEMVWYRPDAPQVCVQRYGGVTSGIWRVYLDEF